MKERDAYVKLIEWVGVKRKEVAELSRVNIGQFSNFLRTGGPLGKEALGRFRESLRSLVVQALAKGKTMGEEEKIALEILDRSISAELLFSRTKKMGVSMVLRVPLEISTLDVSVALSEMLKTLEAMVVVDIRVGNG